MDKSKALELTLDTALTKLAAQIDFCERESTKFMNNNAYDSNMFYVNKIKDFKWQKFQLEQHYKTTNEVLKLKRDSIQVPVLNDNDRIADEELELEITDAFYNSQTESKKTYYLRYVICLPLQKKVLQEKKSDMFKTTNLELPECKMVFLYPRFDPKMEDSLKRGYITVELYGEKKFKAPMLIGGQRVSLSPLMDGSCLKGMLTFGTDNEWDISYSLNIRRAQMVEPKDNFKTVEKMWVSISNDDMQAEKKLSRRMSLATMSPTADDVYKKRRGHHHHRRSSKSNHHHHHTAKDLIIKPSSDSCEEECLKEVEDDFVGALPSENNKTVQNSSDCVTSKGNRRYSVF